MNFTGNPIGVQLYTLREECKKDFPGTLRQVAKLGIGSVEFAGLHGHDADEIKDVLAEARLRASSCHVSLGDLEKNFDQIRKTYVETLGCEYVIVPSGPQKFDDGGKTWRDYCAAMHAMTKRCREAGFSLAYHNHAFEFENTVDGKPAHDIMFHENPADSPLAELDICWVAKGKYDPVNEIRRLNGRVKLLHVKDLDPGPPPRDTEVGDGIIQWPPVYKAAQDAGVKWLVIERDNPAGSAFDSVAKSLAFLKRLGLEQTPAADQTTTATATTTGTV